MKNRQAEHRAGGTFREYLPPPGLSGVVWSLWVQRIPAQRAPYLHRTVPDGGVHLVQRLGGGVELRGPQTGPYVEVLDPGVTVIGVRFWPGAASNIFRVSGRDLRDAGGPLQRLPRDVRTLGGGAADETSPREALQGLLDQLVGRSVHGAPPDPLVQRCVRLLLPHHSKTNVGDVASELGVSDRRLRYLFDAHVGVAPKFLQGILRLQGVLADVQTAFASAPGQRNRLTLASLAARHGYFDQAHMTRDFHRLVGSSPSEFLERTKAECGLHHDHAAGFRPLGVKLPVPMEQISWPEGTDPRDP